MKTLKMWGQVMWYRTRLVILACMILSGVMTAPDVFASHKRVFCESDDEKLPHVKFDFYPYDRDSQDMSGNAVMSVDYGQVLDLKQYSSIEIEIGEDMVVITYSDGRIEFDVEDDFVNPGTVKHFGGGNAFLEFLNCYRTRAF